MTLIEGPGQTPKTSGLLGSFLQPLGHALLVAHELVAAAFIGFAAIHISQLVQLGVEGVVDGVVGVQGTSPATETPKY